MAKIIDLKGQKFSRLYVVEFHKLDKNGQAVWECKCDCGNTSFVRSNCLRRGSVKSCGCLLHEKVPPNKLPYGEAAKHKLYNDYKKRAKYGNSLGEIYFDLSYDDFLILTSRTCEYCGREPLNIAHALRSNNGDYIYNGLDRRDNSKGYTKENCVTCCEICNRAKKDLSLKEFFVWIYRLIEFNA